MFFKVVNLRVACLIVLLGKIEYLLADDVL